MLRKSLIYSGFLAVFTMYGAQAAEAPPASAVTAHYADLAAATYGDSSAKARDLQAAVDALLAHPEATTLAAARAAWKAARVPYAQSEVFRFGNATVDNWEPRVNSWPMDEGLIDYVAPSYGTHSDQNPLYTLNVVANTKIRVGARMIDASTIDEPLLRELQQGEGVETNVSTGYHAIEFLLWGQDLHGTGPGARERPASDYDLAHCTHGNCARRAAYLKAATTLLVNDLSEMAADWKPGGKARAEMQAKGATGGLGEILTGLGSLSFGEMAGERMKLGLMLHDPEEEQDCFSDNTHNSHFYDETGILNIWHGSYTTSDGHTLAGPGLRTLALKADPVATKRLDAALDRTMVAIRKIKTTADSGAMAYDQMIGAGNAMGNKMVQDAMEALVAQARAIEGVATALHVTVDANKSDKTASANGPANLH
ncbi:MAG TPA: imelysin family protein [Rhizomicrobium sp.]|jgi:putative iron-regulated protein